MKKYTEEEIRLIRETYDKDEENHGCGYWSVCLEHDCMCHEESPVRQGFDINVWDDMEADMDAQIASVWGDDDYLDAEDGDYDYGDDDEFDPISCFNADSRLARQVGNHIMAVIKKHNGPEIVPVHIWFRPASHYGLIINIGLKDEALLRTVIEEVYKDLHENMDDPEEMFPIAFTNGPDEYRHGYSLLPNGAPIDIYHAIGQVSMQGTFGIMCYDKFINSPVSRSEHLKKLREQGNLKDGETSWEEFEEAYKAAYNFHPSHYHFSKQNPENFGLDG